MLGKIVEIKDELVKVKMTIDIIAELNVCRK